MINDKYLFIDDMHLNILFGNRIISINVSIHTNMDVFAAHMPGEAWTGLNDRNDENHFVYTDGSPTVSYKIPNLMSTSLTKKYISALS